MIRAYQPADRDACLAIFKSNTPAFFDPSELVFFETWLNGQDGGDLAYSNTSAEWFYVAVIQDVVVGCGGFYIAKGEQRANMAWGMVRRDLHKQGIGKELLAHRINVIKQEYPAYSMSLDTTQHTYPFFEKLGFSTTKITGNYYGEGLDRYDMVYNREDNASVV